MSVIPSPPYTTVGVEPSNIQLTNRVSVEKSVPSVLAQTASPREKALLGVVQSAAKVSMVPLVMRPASARAEARGRRFVSTRLSTRRFLFAPFLATACPGMAAESERDEPAPETAWEEEAEETL